MPNPTLALSLEERQAAEQLLVDYARLVDHGDVAGFAALFGDDGVLAFGGKEISTPAKLTKFAERSPSGTHLQALAVFERAEDGTVRAESAFHFITNDKQSVIAGWYHDVLTPRGATFVFARREIEIRTL